MVAFRQGGRDKKMLEKLTTYDIQDVTELFSLVDKCARPVEGHAWHTPPAPEAGKGSKPNASVAAQGGSSKNNNNKKDDDNNHPLVGAPTATAVAVAVDGGRGPRGDKHPRQASSSNDRGARCPVHNSMCHNTEECWKIKKLTKQYHEHLWQQRDDGLCSRQREGKQKVDPEEHKDDGLGFHKARRDLKAVYVHSDSESSDNKRCKTLYVTFEGSWDITSH
jgi:hypothetical protein